MSALSEHSHEKYLVIVFLGVRLSGVRTLEAVRMHIEEFLRDFPTIVYVANVLVIGE
jgi:hypothetical protein